MISFLIIIRRRSIPAIAISCCYLSRRESTDEELLYKLELEDIFGNLFYLVATQRQSLQETNIGRNPLYLEYIVEAYKEH